MSAFKFNRITTHLMSTCRLVPLTDTTKYNSRQCYIQGIPSFLINRCCNSADLISFVGSVTCLPFHRDNNIGVPQKCLKMSAFMYVLSSAASVTLLSISGNMTYVETSTRFVVSVWNVLGDWLIPEVRTSKQQHVQPIVRASDWFKTILVWYWIRSAQKHAFYE